MSNLAKVILEEFNDSEKQEIKSWAEEAYVIRNDQDLTRKEKLSKLKDITSSNKIIIKFLKASYRFTRKHAWDNRGLPARLALGGLAIGVTGFGGKAAGIATAGFGIGVPIYLLTSAGGALLGTIVQELKK